MPDKPAVPLTVWYNTKCPVCNAGINWQRNRLLGAVRAGAIIFHDINLEPNALAAYGATLEDVRRRLHAVDVNGRFFVGAACAAEIWRRTPGDTWLYWLAKMSGPLAGWVYDSFAAWLYGWNRRKGHW
jgi:predicted DCC family thiol-disulfide oxidoreductase YuxK